MGQKTSKRSQMLKTVYMTILTKNRVTHHNQAWTDGRKT